MSRVRAHRVRCRGHSAAVVLVAGSVLAACAIPGAPSGAVMTDVQVQYVDFAADLDELQELAQAVVLVEPIGGERVVWAEDIVEMVGQDVVVRASFQGDLEPGATVTVVRMVVRGTLPGPNQGQFSDAERAALQEAASMEPVSDEPPFDLPAYVLGLHDSAGFYGVEAWHVTGGPHGRIPLDAAIPSDTAIPLDVADTRAGEDVHVVVESSGTPLQEGLRGQTLAEIVEGLGG